MEVLTWGSHLGHGVAGLNVLAATQPTSLFWYSTRTAAISAYVTLSLSVMFGILRTIARRSGARLSWVVDELHQFTATVAWVLVIGHLVTLRLDPYSSFTDMNLLLPMNEPYRPLAVNLGVLALYAMLVLLLSSWARHRLSYGFWRGLHYVSFLAFALVTAHGWLAGSDSGEPWARGMYAVAATTITFLLLVRLFVGGAAASQQA